ncbi:MAG: hypothetical protein ACLR0U_09620 [Enterocloster clostridioformis]
MTTTEARRLSGRPGGYQGSRDNNRPQGGGYQGSRSQGGYQEAREAARAAVTTTGPREAAIRGSRSQGSYQGGQEAARAAATTTGPREAAIRQQEPSSYQEARGYQGSRDNNRPGEATQGQPRRRKAPGRLWKQVPGRLRRKISGRLSGPSGR